MNQKKETTHPKCEGAERAATAFDQSQIVAIFKQVGNKTMKNETAVNIG